MNFRLSIRKKLMFSIVGITILIYLLIVGYIAYNMRRQFISKGREQVKIASSEKAYEIESVLAADVAIAKSMASVVRGYLELSETSRVRAKDHLLESILKDNPKYSATWLSWELGAIDPDWTKTYGRQRNTCYYEDGELKFYTELVNMDGDPSSGPYIESKRNPATTIGGPYEYSAYGGQVDKKLLGVSPTAPIMVNGKFMGIIGTDMFLNEFDSIPYIDFFDRGFAYLVTNDGMVVSHENVKLVNLPIDSLSVYNGELGRIKAQIAKGEEFTYEGYDSLFDEEVVMMVTPVQIGESGKPWAVAVEIPKSEITKAFTKTIINAALVAILGLIVLMWVTYRSAAIIARALDGTSKTLQKLSEGDLEFENRLRTDTNDELGELAASVNQLIAELRKKAQFSFEIGKGNLDFRFEASGNQDVLGKSLLRMRENLQLVIVETNAVIEKALKEGDLSTARIRTSWESGAWSELSGSINNLLESMSSYFGKIQDVVNRMAEGDISQRLSDSTFRGDILSMAQGLNKSLDNLSTLIEQISHSSLVVSESSAEMLLVSEEMTVNTREIASSIAQMSNGAQNQVTKVDESSSLVETILRSSQDMGYQAEEITNAARMGVENSDNGQKLIQRVGFSMRDIAAFSSDTYDSIQVLTRRSQEIARVLGVITDIASQTNLLALNAAIEAAQAGDAGRGFAVVAEEIRKLAEDSKNSAKQIEQLVSDVQNDVRTTSQAIEMMKSSVRNGEEATSSASDAFNQITDSSSKILNLSEDIRKKGVEQTESIKNVVTITESVVVIAEQTAAGSEEVASSATELSAGMDNYVQKSKSLSGIASELKSGVSKFRLK